jgi:glycosyltransferase involved in cell wall biosynthesis
MINKKILFLVPYPINKAPSQRLKFEQYYSYFEKNGFELTHHSFIDINFWGIIYKKGHYLKKIIYTLKGYFNRTLELFTLRKYDAVYIHLWITPIGPPLFEFLVHLISKKIIYDIDDLVYIRNNPHENNFRKIIKGKSKSLYLIKHSNHVITCTPHLDSYVKKYNLNTTDISSTINTEEYKPTKNENKKITLGWSGSHSTGRYLYLLKNVLLKVNKIHPFRLLVIGYEAFHIEGLDIDCREWNPETEVKDLNEIDIGLYPLPLEQEWVLGKSGLKALQYMALEIPTIATAVGANFRIINDKESGFLVQTEAEWEEKILLLMSDIQLREQIGKKARELVEKNYSIKANRDTYLSILQRVCESIN